MKATQAREKMLVKANQGLQDPLSEETKKGPGKTAITNDGNATTLHCLR